MLAALRSALRSSTAPGLVLVGSALVPTSLSAQEEASPFPSPEEYAARAEAAERAPLFSAHEPLVLTLRTDIKWLRDKRPNEEEVEGVVVLEGPDGATTLAVDVRTRGNFRRDPRNCNFPPLRLDFPTKQVEGTVFEGQDKLKLVTPCHDSRDNFQQYVLQEYLAYRTYNLLTPVGYRVRLVHITYEDVNQKYDTRTKTAFLIESDEAMAARNRATISVWEAFHPLRLDNEQASVMALFQYMIGNTDWSAVYFHNSVLIRREDGVFLPIPYDFDFAGVVNARYATPDPQLSIRDVRERLFRGFCREGTDHEALKERFHAQHTSIRDLYVGMAELEDGQRKRALEYYDKFYETLDNPGRYEREILRPCLEVPTD